MIEAKLSPLEAEILDVFHELYLEDGFPERSRIRVVGRQNTGAGRYVKLESECCIVGPDRFLDMKGKFIQMDKVPDGMMAVIWIEAGRVRELEIATYGEVSWSGNEGTWSIVGGRT